MPTTRFSSIVIVVVLGLATRPLAAQAPLGTVFSYQGRLKDAGSPANGTYDLRFVLYDQLIGGIPQGPMNCADNVAVADGLFTVELDFGAQFAGQERFLELAVRADSGLGCNVTTGFVPLSPRQALTGAPIALFALNADTLDGLNSTAFLQSIPVPLTLSGTSASHIIRGNNSSNNGQSVGVYGHTTGTGGGLGLQGQQRGGAGIVPTYGAGMFGSSDTSFGVAGFSGTGDAMWALALGTTGPTNGLTAESRSTSGTAVRARASASSGTTYGAYGQSDSPEGYGVYGLATSTTGWNFGGWFESAGVNGRGVVGKVTSPTGSTLGGAFESDSTNGYGVWARAGASSGNTYGGWFQSSSTSGQAVHGWASAGSGATEGGHFESGSNSGIGVVGLATADNGSAYGGQFTSESTSGRGAYGSATAVTGSTFGGYFESASTSGYGVYGRASATSGTIYGIRGYASTLAGGYAVYAAGDMGASGTKPFRIDHPQDPENKYLLHYAAESPEVINFYRGTATLDERGDAIVELPQYFGMINKSPSYQLTAIGAAMPNLHVAEEISEDALQAGEQAAPGDVPPTCSFRIAGGVAGAKVSWEVKAVRNDLRTRLHGAPVEREKSDSERGKYQHPEYYGLGPERGMDNHAEPRRAAHEDALPAPRSVRDDDDQSE